jgi:hypothetical protein
MPHIERRAELDGGGHKLLDALYAGVWWSAGDSGAESGECVGRAGRFDFHGAIGKVPYVSAQCEVAGGFASEGAESDALYAPVCPEADAVRRRLFHVKHVVRR